MVDMVRTGAVTVVDGGRMTADAVGPTLLAVTRLSQCAEGSRYQVATAPSTLRPASFGAAASCPELGVPSDPRHERI